MELTPELIQSVLQIGGAPALIALMWWKSFNGTKERTIRIEEGVNDLKDDLKDVAKQATDNARDIAVLKVARGP